jgi:hypothetical protein
MFCTAGKISEQSTGSVSATIASVRAFSTDKNVESINIKPINISANRTITANSKLSIRIIILLILVLLP